jgi:hypothetical protein
MKFNTPFFRPLMVELSRTDSRSCLVPMSLPQVVIDTNVSIAGLSDYDCKSLQLFNLDRLILNYVKLKPLVTKTLEANIG